jgi:hypothetical protein
LDGRVPGRLAGLFSPIGFYRLKELSRRVIVQVVFKVTNGNKDIKPIDSKPEDRIAARSEQPCKSEF